MSKPPIPGVIMLEIECKLDRANYGYVKGTLSFTDEGIAFRSHPLFPETHFTFTKDQIVTLNLWRQSANDPYNPGLYSHHLKIQIREPNEIETKEVIFWYSIHPVDQLLSREYSEIYSNNLRGRQLSPGNVAERNRKASRLGSAWDSSTQPIPTPPKPKLATDEEQLLHLIRAYRRNKQTKIQDLAELLNTTPADIELDLAKLIGVGILKGYIQDDIYHHPSEIRVKCQLCDLTYLNPNHYYQCDQCKRIVCENCAPTLARLTCPAHPQQPTKIQKMPLFCFKCNSIYSDLTELQTKELICPTCQIPLEPA